MQVWTKSTKFIAILQILSLKHWTVSTASIAADSIVNAISFITGVLFCDQKTSFSQIQLRLRLRPDLSS